MTQATGLKSKFRGSHVIDISDWLNQWFPEWAVPPPGGAVEVGPSERVVCLFTIAQARAYTPGSSPRAKYLPHFVFKVLLFCQSHPSH